LNFQHIDNRGGALVEKRKLFHMQIDSHVFLCCQPGAPLFLALKFLDYSAMEMNGCVRRIFIEFDQRAPVGREREAH
jgi:hypothetical protein